MSPEFERSCYLLGIELFNSCEFFEAHEAWEDVWGITQGLKHSYYQAIIQCAVALEHYRRGNPRGVLSLHRSYQKHFANVPSVFMGLDVRRFMSQMEAVLKPVVDAQPIPSRGEIRLDLGLVPRFVLLYDPFENGEAGKYGPYTAGK